VFNVVVFAVYWVSAVLPRERKKQPAPAVD
jgi:hypothetical protein